MNDVFQSPRHNWWEAPEEDADDQDLIQRSNSLISYAQGLENMQSEIHQQNLWNAQLYSNRELAAFDWGSGHFSRASMTPVSRLGENLVEMVVDTLVSLIGKNRPKAKPVCRGASWKVRRQAKKLDKFLYGEFIRNRVYEIGKRVFRDACVFGFGAVHIKLDGPSSDAASCIERVFPDELMVDQAETAACGRPRHLYRRRVLPVEIVAEMYDVDPEELLEAAGTEPYLDNRQVGKGWVVLVEGWQLQGRYVAAVRGMPPLADKPWKHDHFPFVFYHYSDPLSGFYTAGAVEKALNYQIRLNEINEVIRDAQDLMARPRILVAQGSQVSPAEFDNLVGRIIKYTGIKPEPTNWPAVSAELYNERDRCVSTCLAQFGLNAASTTAQMPSGFRADSSAAVREYNQLQDGRLADPAQRFEQFYLDVADMIVKVIRASGSKPKTVWYSGGKKARMDVIEWEHIDLEESAYVLQLEASSILNLTPAAMKDELEKQLAQGLISPERYQLELSMPDQEGAYSLLAAAAEDIEETIEELEDGKRPRPMPFQDLVNGVETVSMALLRARRYPDCPAYVLQDFIDWIDSARSWLRRGANQDEPAGAGQMMDPAMAAQAGGMMPPPMMPQAMAPTYPAFPVGPQPVIR